jgi:hypothetical protein
MQRRANAVELEGDDGAVGDTEERSAIRRSRCIRCSTFQVR